MMPIKDCQLSHQKVCQKMSVIITNSFADIKNIVNFGISIQLLSLRHQNMITEIFWLIFWLDNWRSLIGVVKNFRNKSLFSLVWYDQHWFCFSFFSQMQWTNWIYMFIWGKTVHSNRFQTRRRWGLLRWFRWIQ